MMGFRAFAYMTFDLIATLITLSLPPILGTMGRDNMGHLLSCDQMEAVMDELKWEILTEVQGRLEADLLQSYFEAYGIEIEFFQESVGHHIYPVTVDGLGRVQLFVSKEQAKEAHQLLDEYNTAKE